MFGVVIPLWNKRHTIAAAVASVLGQTWEGFELIIVDDGSTDGSMDMLDQFGDPRIRRLTQANAGPGPARNAGIEAARHDWIAFLDADDLWLPDHLAELDRIRRSCPDAGLIGTAFRRIGPNAVPPPRAPGRPMIETVDYFERMAEGEWLLCASSAAIPRSSYAALGGFGDDLRSQDSEYWARIALERPVAVSRRVTAVYRLGTGGISDGKSAGLGRAIRRLADVGALMALLVDRYPGIDCPRMRRGVDRFIDHQVHLCIRHSARIGDFATLRALPGVCPRPPRLADRAILALGRMPPLARMVFGLGTRAKALLRLVRHGLPVTPRFNLESGGHAD
jgi:glycosyltransferase involved in cell wall biosynthesis